MRKRHVVLAAATVGVALLGVSRQAYATSYASGLTISGTTATFNLNESINGTNAPAGASNGDVTLYYNGTSQDLGALPAGTQTITLNTAPTTPVQVVVTTHDAPGYLATNTFTYTGFPNSATAPGSQALEIDPAGNSPAGAVLFGAPGGIAIDTNPADATFGRVYGSNYATNGNPNLPQIGLYVMNADLTFLGANPTEATGPVQAYNAGLTFQGADGPWRLAVGSDGYLYISDWSDATGGLYRAQQDVTNGLVNGVNVLAGVGYQNPAGTSPNQNHADIDTAAVVQYSGSTMDVYAIDTHLNGTNGPAGSQQLYKWSANNPTFTPANGAFPPPDGITSQATDLLGQNNIKLDARYWPSAATGEAEWEGFASYFALTSGGPNNQMYVNCNRSAGTVPGLMVLSPDGNAVVEWTSLDETERQGLGTVDFLLGGFSISTSADGRFLEDAQGNSPAQFYGAFMVPLLAGIPDVKLSSPFTMNASGNIASGLTTNRTSAFDAAGNVYVANSSNATLKGFGPGGTSVAITGSNGTFTTGGQWTADSNGNLSDTSKWLVGYLPNGSDQEITFGATTTAQRTVSVDSTETVGAIAFSSPNGYVLSVGGGSISMTGLGANFFANAGNNTIAAPVTINTDVGYYAAAGASLTISGAITYAPVTQWSNTARPNVVKNGAGTVTVSNLNLLQGNLGDASSGNLDIYQGTLALKAGSGPAVVSELSVFDQYGAKLDLTNNDLVYNYNITTYSPNSPLSVVQGLVVSAYDNGKWDGAGITSSTAAATKGTALAVAENSALPGGGFSTVDGQTVTSTTVLVKYTWYGDLNLDGVVDSSDVALMSDGNSGWIGGDLNYDGVVNADDWGLFMLGSAVSGGHSITAPEPASLGLLALAAVPMVRRRRA